MRLIPLRTAPMNMAKSPLSCLRMVKSPFAFFIWFASLLVLFKVRSIVALLVIVDLLICFIFSLEGPTHSQVTTEASTLTNKSQMDPSFGECVRAKKKEPS